MAQATGSDSTKTNTGNTRRAELLWKVLEGPLIQTLAPVKPAVIEMGTMGKRTVQKSGHQMAETKV